MSTLAIPVGNGRTGADVSFQSQRSNTVIILERDGSLARSGPENEPCPSTSGYAELPADLVQETNLIDRVLAFAFDTLGLNTLEMRIREQGSYQSF